MMWLVASLGLLLLGAFGALLLGRRGQNPSAPAAVFFVAGAALGCVPALGVLAGQPAPSLRLPWPVPYGEFFLELDALSAWFLLPLFVLSALAAVYGVGYWGGGQAARRLGSGWFFYGLLVFALRRPVLRRGLLVATAAAHAALTAACWRATPAPALHGWLALDAAGLLFLSLTSALFLAAAVYAAGYLKRGGGQHTTDAEEGFLFDNARDAIFVGCLLLFLAAMTLVTVSQHFGLQWVAIEATTLASAPLICFHRHHRSLEATWKYLLICSVGIALALLANFFLGVAAAQADGAGGSLVLGEMVARQNDGLLALCATGAGDAYRALTPACPQAHWFEREIAEQWGVRPEGHPWLKPIRFHASYRVGRDAWGRGAQRQIEPCVTEFFRVEGDEVHEVAVGPVHAGIIEPGHFRFQCHGEQVFHLEIALGYQHRGIERALVSGLGKRTLAHMETLAGDTTIGHTLAYCEAVEALAGCRVPARACGIERDARAQFPSGHYRFAQIPVSSYHTGNVFARAYVRWLEIQRSLAFLESQAANLPTGPVRAEIGPLAADSVVVSLVEGWRGEICHVASTDAVGRFAHYKVVDPSFHNWMGLALALRDQQISDFPLCNKSFNLSYCGHDL